MPMRLVRRLPVGVRTYPLDAAFVVLGIPTSLVSLLRVSNSTALGMLPVWTETLWSAVLLIGCVAWLLGIISTRLDIETNTVIIGRVPAMLLGLSLVCIAALVYAVAVIVSAGWSGVLASLYPFAIAGGTYIRRADILGRLRNST